MGISADSQVLYIPTLLIMVSFILIVYSYFLMVKFEYLFNASKRVLINVTLEGVRERCYLTEHCKRRIVPRVLN